MVSLEFSFRLQYGRVVYSATNIHECQEYFLGGKGGRCVGLTTLPPSSADCLENLGALNTVQPVQALTRIDVVKTY